MRAVKDREGAHKRFRSHPSAETHALYISARNHAKFILQLSKNSFINKNCQNLSNYNSLFHFWHLANNITNNFTSACFSPLIQPDGSTTVSFFSSSKVELFAQTFATNSTLDDTGHILPIPPPSVYFIPKIKILHYDVFHALFGLDSRKTYGPDGVPPVVPVLPNSLPAWSNSFVCVSLLLPILLGGILLPFNLSLKGVTAPILQTIAL